MSTGQGAPDLRVGIDLVRVSEVGASVGRFGTRYVERIFTDHELECCRTGRGVDRSPSFEASLAARFAAKEAALKVLRPVGPRPAWRDLEVRRDGAGRTGLRLSGRAAVLAERAGLESLTVHLTHQEPLSAAVAVGVCHPGGDPHDRSRTGTECPTRTGGGER